METYQIGNKVNCIIRAYSPMTIGETVLAYDNQPYTILKDVQVRLNFRNKSKEARIASERELAFNVADVDSATISNVHLTKKIFELMFNTTETVLKSAYESVTADEDGKIYLTTDADEIYQVFIYNEEQELVQAYGEVDPSTITLTPDSNYLVVYQVLGEYGLALSSLPNFYLKLDFICEGNTDNATATTFIHLDKVGLIPDKTMYFNQQLNAVDLQFRVIPTENDYITLR